jgi:hypothetical protein
MLFETISRFITKNGYAITKIYTYDGHAIYIEMSTIYTIDSILLHIADAFKVPLSDIPSNILVQPLQVVSYNPNETNNTDEQFIQSIYSLRSSLSPQTNNLSLPDRKTDAHLNEQYKQEVILDDVEQAKKKYAIPIYNQLNRLKYCMKGLPYRLGISESGYMGVLDLNDDVKLYRWESHRREKDDKKYKRLHIMIPFKTFYDKVHTVEQDCKQIVNSIHSILSSNQQLHSTNVKEIIDKKEKVLQQTGTIQKRREEYAQYILKYTDLLEELYSYQTSKQYELEQLNRMPTEHLHIQQDMKRTHQKQRIEKDLRKMDATKKDLIRTIEILKRENDTMMLMADCILFDNIVMVDKIISNFKQLQQFD